MIGRERKWGKSEMESGKIRMPQGEEGDEELWRENVLGKILILDSMLVQVDLLRLKRRVSYKPVILYTSQCNVTKTNKAKWET